MRTGVMCPALRRHEGVKLGHTCLEQSSVGAFTLSLDVVSARALVARRSSTAREDKMSCMVSLCARFRTQRGNGRGVPLNCMGQEKPCRGGARQGCAEKSTDGKRGNLLARRWSAYQV